MNPQAFAMEIVLTAVATFLLIWETVGATHKRALAYFALAGLLATALAGWWTLDYLHQPAAPLLGGSLIVDPFALFFKYLAVTITFIAILISIDYVETQTHYPGEFYSLVLFVCLGMLVISSVGDLITLFIGIELLSMPMYALAAYLKFNKQSAEAGFKFFLLGAVSSAFYLYGATLVYAMLGTTRIAEFADRLHTTGDVTPALLLALVCIIAAFGFKIAVAPFHMWAPDTYQGSPTPVTAFLSTGPKAAGIALVTRFFLQGFGGVHVRPDWVMIFMVLSMLSMVVGNMAALPQTNIKRMLAFSGVSHMGYILIGVAAAGAGSETGVAASLFYVAIYTLTNLGAWAVVIAVTLATGSDEIKDFAGLSRRAPALAAILFLAMLSLAGVPPLAGFIGKFYLFAAAWNYVPLLVIFGILNSVISLYYYLGVLRAAYFEAPLVNEPIAVPFVSRLALGMSTLAIVVLGLVPSFTSWTVDVAKNFMGKI